MHYFPYMFWLKKKHGHRVVVSLLHNANHLSWWRHQMETFSVSLPVIPRKGQWRRALLFSFICAWTNGWANNIEPGDLRHHRANYVTVMMYSETTHPLSKLPNPWSKRDGHFETAPITLSQISYGPRVWLLSSVCTSILLWVMGSVVLKIFQWTFEITQVHTIHPPERPVHFHPLRQHYGCCKGGEERCES